MPRHARLSETGGCNRTTAGIWGSAGAPRGGNRLKTAILQQPYREGRKLNQFDTIKAETEDEFVEKRSRFLCAIAPVRSPEEAAAFLARRRERHYDARHTVYAYILREGNREKYSDDGEPQGTGGQPVLEVIRRAGLTDVCVAVTRYFGGILLGAGGLSRAYANGAALAVAAAERITYRSCADCRIGMAYPRYGLVSRLLPDYGAQVLASSFGERVELTVRLPEERLEELRAALTEATAGAVEAEFLQEIFAAL